MSGPVTTHVEGPHLLRHEVGAVVLPRDVVRAVGPDAVSYLQGQLSQDMDALPAGTPLPALVLEPNGKVHTWMRVWGREGDEVLIDVEAGAGQALVDRLDRFRLRVQVEFGLEHWQLVAVRGPNTPEIGAFDGAAELVAPVDWSGLRGVDLLGPRVAVPPGIPSVTPEALEVVRIEAGRPAMGAELGPELDPQVIPAEAGEWLVNDSVSFTKGCYTGQELVARVDSRGSNTPRKLRGLVIEGDTVPLAGAEVLVDDTVRGVLTSVGRSVELAAPVALGYLHRSVDPGVVVAVRWTAPDGAGGTCTARVRELPLVRG